MIANNGDIGVTRPERGRSKKCLSQFAFFSDNSPESSLSSERALVAVPTQEALVSHPHFGVIHF